MKQFSVFVRSTHFGSVGGLNESTFDLSRIPGYILEFQTRFEVHPQAGCLTALKTFLKEFKAPKIKIPIDFQYLLALPRSIVRLGIFDGERVYYWKLFFWTLFRRPRLFPLAITFTIYGYHFRQICSLHIS